MGSNDHADALGRALGRQTGGTLLSAGLSSGTNFAVVVLASALLDARSFGIFSLILMLALFGSTVVNSFTGQVCLTYTEEAEAGSVSRDKVLASSAFMSWIMGFVGLLVGGVGLLITDDPHLWLFVGIGLLIAVPAATIHSVVRYVAFAQRRAIEAVWLDLIWLTATAIGIVLLVLIGEEVGHVWLIIVWALGAIIAVVVRERSFPVPSLGRTRSWFVRHRRFGSSLAYNSGANIAAQRTVALVVAGFIGLAEVGGLRLAETIFGVCTVFFSAARARAIPALSPSNVAGGVRRQWIRRISLGLVLVPSGLYIALVTSQRVLGAFIDDETWKLTQPILLPVALTAIASALIQGPLIGLRIASAARKIVYARTLQSLAILVGGIVGVVTGDVVGAAWGLAFGNACGAGMWWIAYYRSPDRDVQTN